MVTYIFDFHEIADIAHVATYLLEIRAGHRDDRIKLGGVDRDLRIVQIQKVELVYRLCILVPVFNLDTQVIDVDLIHEKREGVGAIDRLDQLVKVEHVDADAQLVGLAVIMLKLVCVELQVNQHDMRRIHRNDLQPILIKLDASVCQELFQGFNQDFE